MQFILPTLVFFFFSTLLTGGDPVRTGTSEAEKMMELMMEMGIEKEKIMMEPKANTTVENAVFVMEMIKAEAEKGKIKLIIVTSAYHVPFSAWCFRQVVAATWINVEFETVSATGPASSPSRWIIVLRGENWLSIMKHKLKSNGVELGDDIKFESLEKVIQETESILDSNLYKGKGNCNVL